LVEIIEIIEAIVIRVKFESVLVIGIYWLGVGLVVVQVGEIMKTFFHLLKI